jgi:16S rRNA (guanine(966)-N(2))-methyltransferase RsmD
VRPTSDRVRESIFNRLGDLDGARVLDLFAGSGALGIEALSRGADRVLCVDVAQRSVRCLERNLSSLGIEERIDVMRRDARGALRRLAESGERFDLVLMDPPYESPELSLCLAALAESGLLVPGATVVVETAKRHAVSPVAGLQLESERTYGDTAVLWLVADETGADSAKMPQESSAPPGDATVR